ncbi:MAG: response regulator, partial [Deltaproteobacteria bacterium]|nr:response regulator [Deltaproteobacteria bacterium]
MRPPAWRRARQRGSPVNALKRERDASLVVDRPGRILVVDDDAAIRRLMFDVLRRAGHVVECVESAELAHPRLDDVDFDLVVVDLALPGQDGADFLREALRANPDLVAVVMTGQGSVRSAVDCMKTGAFDYIQKPFPPSALLGVIDRGMEVRRLRTENIQLRETVAIYELG